MSIYFSLQEIKARAEYVYHGLLSDVSRAKNIYVAGLNAAGEADFICKIYPSVIFVDDTKSGSQFCGRNIISTQEMAKNCSDQDFLIINCLGPAGFNHFSRQADSLGIPSCSIVEVLAAHCEKGVLMNFGGMTAVYGAAFHSHTLKNIEKYESLRSNFRDNLSLRTFDDLIKYRLTGNPNLLYNVAVGWNFGAIQHDSYVLNSQFFKLSSNEVFIDAGALDGTTSKFFIESVSGEFERVVMFEPSSESAQKCREAVDLLDKKFPTKKIKDKVVVVESGLYDHTGVLPISLTLFNKTITEASGMLPQSAHFLETGLSDSFTEKGTEYKIINVPVTTLDEYIGDFAVSFIKFEIEGSEVAALQGAKKTILKNKPKLALSIYHRPQDLELIIDYVVGLDAGYKMALRAHNSLCPDAIVLYCWI